MAAALEKIEEGESTSWPKAVQRRPQVTVVFSRMSWPSNEAHDTGMQGVVTDPVMEGYRMPFDGKRMI